MDLITIGEALVIFSPQDAGPLRFVNNFTKSIGGAEANVAIALSRLGYQTGWISALGNDEFGRYISYALQGDKVDVSQVTYNDNLPTGLLFKEHYQNANPNVYYYRNSAAITQINPAQLDNTYIQSSKIVHVTGILPALSKNCQEITFRILEQAKQNKQIISFDPNLRMKLWQDKEHAKQTLLKMVSYADIIFPGLDEAEFLLGTSDISHICNKLHNLGCKIVVLKLGKDGCLISENNQHIYVKGYPPHRFIDSVGAGDGFAAGFLAGILGKKTLQECGELANGVGSMATMVRGDSEGYPTMNQLLEFIGKTKSIER